MHKFVLYVLLLLILCSGSLFGQDTQDQWLRVITAEEYITDIERTSLVVGPGSVIAANFRTVFAKSEQLATPRKLSYRKRLDSIQFRTTDRNYRVVSSTYLDQDGQNLFQTSTADAGWKRLGSLTGPRLYSAASQLSPFGQWKVLSYRYASGEGPADDDPPELKALIGSTIRLGPRHLFIGRSNCPGVIFEAKSISDSDVSLLLGTSLKTLKVEGPIATVIHFDCRGNDEYPRGIYAFPLSRSRAILLWDGVFLDIERPPNPFIP